MATKKRPLKRARVGEAHHDSIPFRDDFTIVHAREGQLLRIGNNFLTAPAERAPQHEADSAFDSASDWLPIDDPQFALDPDGAWYDEAVTGDVMDQDSGDERENAPSAAKKKKYIRSRVSVCLALFRVDIGSDLTQRRPHVVWRDVHRQTYLEEVIRWAGRADFRGAKECPDCAARGSATVGPPEYRCREYFLADLVCQTCCVKRHRSHPLHRIEVHQVLIFGVFFSLTHFFRNGQVQNLSRSP